MNKKLLLLTYITVSIPSLSLAEHNHHDHHNHISAPVGVMGDHNHNKNEWMISYRYSEMKMAGNKKDSNNVSTDEVLNDFMVAPLEMIMKMHMFGAMRGISDDFTLMIMLPYKEISMDHKNRMGVNFTTESKGMGDIKLSGLYNLYQRDNLKILFNAGISLPTGDIDKRDDTPAGSNQKLPYPMQLGSGTYDLLPSLAYSNRKGAWAWGAQFNSRLHLGQNDEHYSLGDSYNLTFWESYKITNSLDGYLRINGKIWEDIDGLDPELNPAMVPTARTDLRSGKKIDLLFGANFTMPNNKSNTLIAAEFGLPLYQKLAGPQLKSDYIFTIGSQIIF